MSPRLAFAIAAVLLGSTRPAAARDREWRLSVDGGASLTAVSHLEADTTVVLAGGGLRGAYGLAHNWELGGRLRAGYGSTLRLPDAVYMDQPGTLWFSALDIELVADLRFVVGIQQADAFERTHPLVGVHAGVRGRWFRTPILVDPTDGGSVRDQPGEDLQLLPLVGLDAGVEHRFGRALVIGLVATGDYSLDGLTTRVALEVSWHWY